MFVAAREVLELDELLSFDPRTVRLELQDAFGIPRIDYDTFGKLMAMVAVIGTDRFYRDLPAFIDICNILSGQVADVDIWDPADPYEIAWALTETGLLEGRDAEEPFSEEIRAYIGMSLYEHGFFSPPPSLSLAIMPDDARSPADVTADAELLPAIVSADIDRHAELDQMLRENVQELAAQLRPFISPA